MVLGLLLLQAAGAMMGPPVPAAMRAPVPAVPCPNGVDGEVVVCGRPTGEDPQRLKRLPDVAADDPQLRFRLPGGGTIAADNTAAGWGSTRVMAKVRIPF